MSQSNNSNTDYLATLPYELISELFSKMDITAMDEVDKQVSSAKDADGRYSKVIAASDERRSILKYLNDNFGNGKKLLTAMGRSDVYISGSRSTEFFCPGSIGSHSDWDFFLPHNMLAMYHFMRDLEEIGVTWLTPTDSFNRRVMKDGDSITVSVGVLGALTDNGTLEEKIKALNLESVKLIGDPGLGYCNVSVSNGFLEVNFREPEDGYEVLLGDICIIHGEIVHHGTVMPVQLITQRRVKDDVCRVTAPFGFHSSVVQSFIGPVSAGHMYGKLASEKKAYGWNVKGSAPGDRSVVRTSNVIDTTGVRQWNKYEDRGFEFMYSPEAEMDFTLRHIRDSMSHYIEYAGIIDLSPDVQRLYLQCSRSMTWYQTATCTIPAHCSMPLLYGFHDLKLLEWFGVADVRWSVCYEYLCTYTSRQSSLRTASCKAWRSTDEYRDIGRRLFEDHP
jgi:hypothetical protein